MAQLQLFQCLQTRFFKVQSTKGALQIPVFDVTHKIMFFSPTRHQNEQFFAPNIEATWVVKHCHDVATHRHCTPQVCSLRKVEYFQRGDTCCWQTQSARRPDCIASERLLTPDSLWQVESKQPHVVPDKAAASTSSTITVTPKCYVFYCIQYIFSLFLFFKGGKGV